jgi:hypothetical protein
MKLDVTELAQFLLTRNLSVNDLDSSRTELLIIEYLAEQKLFDKLYDEMNNLEQEKHKPRNADEYREKIGEF